MRENVEKMERLDNNVPKFDILALFFFERKSVKNSVELSFDRVFFKYLRHVKSLSSTIECK